MQFYKIGTQKRKISDNDFSFGHESIFLVEDDVQQAGRNIDKLMSEEDIHFFVPDFAEVIIEAISEK